MKKLILLAFLLVAGIARADCPDHPHGPPPEAYDACAQKKSGDSCEVALRDRTLDGTCAAAPDGKLACRPSQPPGPPPDQTSP